MLISKENFSRNVSLAWPMALNAMLLQSAIIIDLMLIAPLGEISIAALGIASALISFLTGIQYAMANGTQILIARANGANNADLLTKTLAAGWLLNFAFSMITFCFIWLSMHRIIQFVSDDIDVQIAAIQYLKITSFMLLVSSLTQVMIVFFNGSRKTRIPLYGFMIEMPCNVAVSWVLIYGYFGFPEMGLAGAGVGSVFAVVVRLVYLAFQLYRERWLNVMNGFRVMTVATLKHHFSEVSPIAANFVMLTGGAMLYQMLFAQLEVSEYAAITLVFPWMRFGTQFMNSWAQATAINVSQFIGQESTREIPGFVPQAMRITALMSGIIAVGFYLFSVYIPKIYSAMAVETVTALAIIAPIYIVLPLVRTYNTICGHTLRAMGDSFKVLRVHVITQWCISIPLCAVLIYLQAPLFWVFSVIFLEECLKALPFRQNLKGRLAFYQVQ